LGYGLGYNIGLWIGLQYWAMDWAMDWATFWAIFTQTHLATLLEKPTFVRIKRPKLVSSRQCNSSLTHSRYTSIVSSFIFLGSFGVFFMAVIKVSVPDRVARWQIFNDVGMYYLNQVKCATIWYTYFVAIWNILWPFW
jgi:hypothetical protein